MFLSCLNSFSPPRRKERKGGQESRTCLEVLSGLWVFAVKIFRFGVFQRRLILDKGISVTIADASTSEKYVAMSKHYARGVRFFFTSFISRFCVFAANDEKALSLGTVIH